MKSLDDTQILQVMNQKEIFEQMICEKMIMLNGVASWAMKIEVYWLGLIEVYQDLMLCQDREAALGFDRQLLEYGRDTRR